MARKKKDEQQQELQEEVKAQPSVNIGMVGHVDHGKTTLLERLSGKWTDTHSEELKRGITIRLGYADILFRKCEKCKGAKAFTTKEECPHCNSKSVPLRKVSFVDAPGHESLMATMLSGATLMDGAILLVAADEKCPQPQTREHLMALKIIGVKNIIIIQNKIDKVSEEAAINNYESIREFLKDTDYKDAPIIPISAQHNVGISFLIKAIEENIPTPERDMTKEPIMFIARSFDVNKPGAEIKNLLGGVMGGAIKQGKLSVGDEIEIRPGYSTIEKNQQVWKSMKTKITDIKAGSSSINDAFPGGTIGILTSLDPSVVYSDKLVGGV